MHATKQLPNEISLPNDVPTLRERDQHTSPETLREYFDAWWLLVLHLTAKAYGELA